MDLKKIKFEEEYPFTCKEITNILKSMLEFNPYFRKPASQLLRKDIFESLHDKNPNLGKSAPRKITLDIDNKEIFCYEECEFKLHTLNDLKTILLSEIGIIKSKEYQDQMAQYFD